MSKTFKIPANPSQEGGGLHSAQHQTVSIISPSPPAAEENLQTHQSCPSHSIPSFTENSCGPVKQTVHNSAVQLHLVTLRIIHEKQQTAQAIRDSLTHTGRNLCGCGLQGDYHRNPTLASVQQHFSMQVITCALFTLVTLPISTASEADSCPAVCECSEWKTLTISCFDIDILPRFPASTETL